VELRGQRMSLRKIAAELAASDRLTASGRPYQFRPNVNQRDLSRTLPHVARLPDRLAA
jgi:hypothetical protein